MKMDKMAGSANDEYHTYGYAIHPIIKYLKFQNIKKIWCPFDKMDSNFVSELEAGGFEVKYSHIQTGDDFFTTPTPNVDAIVSNPPYSKKTEVFESLFERNIPFAMLVGIVGLFESKRRFDMFSKNNFEIMYFNKRINFFKNKTDSESEKTFQPPFSSVYLTRYILPEKIIFEVIDKR